MTRLFLRLVLPWIALAPGVSAVAATEIADTPGRRIFVEHCAACHGENARGIEDQGADLVDSDFVKATPDAALMDFIKMGRQPDHPDSKMKLLMPAFDALSDEDIRRIIAHIRRAPRG